MDKSTHKLCTVGRTETIAGLNSAELFERLFYQRHGHDASLLMIGQACSLVYSFQGEALSGDDAELPLLGGLIAKSAGELHTGVTELKWRDLLQSRSVWRAVLPHAIANRLAELALQNIFRCSDRVRGCAVAAPVAVVFTAAWLSRRKQRGENNRATIARARRAPGRYRFV